MSKLKGSIILHSGSIILYSSTTHGHPGSHLIDDDKGNKVWIRAVFTPSDTLEALDEAEKFDDEIVLNTIPI